MERYTRLNKFLVEEISFQEPDRALFGHSSLKIAGGLVPDFTEREKDIFTKKVASFYNEVKFPNYDDMEDYGSLIDKGQNNSLAYRLNEDIGWNKDILELGCGTGQLSLFLARGKRTVCAVDLSLGSLLLGERFRKKNDISDVFFMRSDVFDLKFKKDSFDVVISNGVLHHTKNPRQALKNLVEVLKPGGHIVLGLYHRYGRILTRLKQKLTKLVGKKIYFFDRTSRTMSSSAKKFAWVEDQFFNPHESLHLPAEIMDWFNEVNLSFVNLLPFYDIDDTSIFETKNIPSKAAQILHDASLSFNKSQILEGGFFIIVGKKNT